MMTPAGALMIEHRLIERMVRLMREHLERVQAQQTCDPDFIAAAADFLRRYADQCHHGKEEDILFRELAAKTLAAPLKEILDGLMADHVFSRQTTRRLAQANERYRHGEGAALTEIEECVRELTNLYPRHIRQEDQEFFVPAQDCFTAQELAAMLEQFWEFDRQLIHGRYREVVDQWEAAQPAKHP